MEISLVVGTRPEIIKSSPVIRALESKEGVDPFLVHTGQHYNDSLSKSFFDVLELPAPDEHLSVGSGTQHVQTAKALKGIGKVLDARDAAAILAQGDTNAVLSTAIAASKTPTEFGHIEAGLRSFDRSMPEEINRVIADAVADFAFAPTEGAVENLAAEGCREQTFLTGNTVVDACLTHEPIAHRKSTIRNELGLLEVEYVVATVHRPFNTDRKSRLRTIVESLDTASKPVVLPAHPRTMSALDTLGFTPSGSLRLIEPLDHLDFLKLLSGALVTVTDSGGIQEEASILDVPCLTVRPNTERPETVEAGVNRLVTPDELGGELETLLTSPAERGAMTGRTDIYGDGRAGERIVEILLDNLKA